MSKEGIHRSISEGGRGGQGPRHKGLKYVEEDKGAVVGSRVIPKALV